MDGIEEEIIELYGADTLDTVIMRNIEQSIYIHNQMDEIEMEERKIELPEGLLHEYRETIGDNPVEDNIENIVTKLVITLFLNKIQNNI